MSQPEIKLPTPIFILSDSTGDTAEKVVRAMLRQFRGHVVHLKTYPDITQPDTLIKLFQLAGRHRAMVVSTLVRPDMRALADRLGQEHGIHHVDLIGKLLHQLEEFLHQESQGVPGLLYKVDERYFQRIEAVEFTVKADDGKNPKMLKEADLIILGISRTSKTPLCTFLAQKGYKVANIPVVFDHVLPSELFELTNTPVFALTIDPSVLQTIRHSRLRAMNMPGNTNYADIDYILAELEFAEHLYKSHRDWPVIDVTGRAIEETAASILRILRDRSLDEPFATTS